MLEDRNHFVVFKDLTNSLSGADIKDVKYQEDELKLRMPSSRPRKRLKKINGTDRDCLIEKYKNIGHARLESARGCSRPYQRTIDKLSRTIDLGVSECIAELKKEREEKRGIIR